MKNDRKIISISLPEDTAEDIDKTRKDLGLTRSEFFRMMIRKQLGRDLDLASLAKKGGSFDFLEEEEEIYSSDDIK